VVLRKTLQAAGEHGLARVLLTCDTLNTASWKTIERCGGRLENLQDGWRRYWIEIDGPHGEAHQ
jgi:predicted acetyltransferase